jgi:sulfur carrier protein ThiS
MKVKLKLFSTLTDYLPPDQRGNEVEVEIAGPDPIDTVLERLHVPPRLAHLVLVNGIFVPPAQRQSYRLAEGDHLAVWPPIAGG